MGLMKLETFIEDFEASVADVEPGSIRADTAYKQLKSWDSLAVLTVTDTVELNYGVLLRKADFEAATTVGDLYERVNSRLT